MLIWENIKLALSAIRINKMRSFLTMLGMIIGISSVIAIVSIGDTMRSVIADQFDNIGLGRAMVYINSSDGNYSENDLFTQDDIEQLKETFGDRISYMGMNASEQVSIINGRTSTKISAIGVAENYTKVQKITILYGRMIDAKDTQEGKKHIVLQDKTALALFGTENAVGQTIRISRKDNIEELLVVGIFKNTDSALVKLLSGNNMDTAYVPESILKEKDATSWSLDLFMAEGINTDIFQKQFIGVLSRMKNKTPGEIDFYTAQENMKMVDGLMAKLSLAVGAIAGISLLVGGIGIMNIMLVSVTERTREIGIRKALGARTGDVLMQFLIESALISAGGGIIGTSLGIGVVMIGAMALGASVVVKPMVVITAVVFSAVVGIFFGLYPARKAAKADPITALRYE